MDGGKTMYYSAGNYEAFAHPQKPSNADKKSAYIIGDGLAGLTAAFFLVRDAQVKGSHIHILEKDPLGGGACDGYFDPKMGYIMRGGREMDNHFEVMWDVYRDVPTLDNPDVSVLDEYYWLNKKDPNYSLCRATINRGENANTGLDFTLDKKAQRELLKLFLTTDEDLAYKKISDVFTSHFFKSNFWLYWQTMFAFQETSSALEMKLYLQRYVHHIDGLPDFSALRFTRYNQYESMILPLEKYLKDHGVDFQYGVEVKDVVFDTTNLDHKVATKLVVSKDDNLEEISLVEDDLVFITNGSCVDSSCYGDQNHAPDLSKIKEGHGSSFDMWKRIASQTKDNTFGHPEVFCSNIKGTNWMSATIDCDDELVPYIKKICKRDPHSGKVVTGGIITAKDSWDNWRCSWTINRQGQFKNQPKDRTLVWFYSLHTDVPGNYIKKRMKECTGKEIAMEWMYLIGVPEDKIEELASKHVNVTTAYMPYIDAFFEPRGEGDRPYVVPKGAVNFAFLGQFAEIKHDTIFTTEYSMRTGMEAVYNLMNVDRGVPEVWGSRYDVRELLRATYYALDRKKITEAKMNPVEKAILKKALKLVKNTEIEKLLKESKLI